MFFILFLCFELFLTVATWQPIEIDELLTKQTMTDQAVSKTHKVNSPTSSNWMLIKPRLNLALLCFKKLSLLMQSIEGHLYIYLISIIKSIRNNTFKT